MSRTSISLVWLSMLLLSLHTAFAADTGPRVFIENQGQMPGSVLYYSPGYPASVYILAGAIVLDIKTPEIDGVVDLTRDRGCAVWIGLDLALTEACLEPKGKVSAQYNYFIGNDPSDWHTGVSAYEEIVCRDIWQDNNMVLRGDAGGLQYEVFGTADLGPGEPRFILQGADRVSPMTNGISQIETPTGGLIIEHWDAEKGAGAFIWDDGNLNSSAPRAQVPANPDALISSTLLGGPSEDIAFSLALDSLGNPIVTGYTSSTTFPTTPGAYDRFPGTNYNVYVSKISSCGGELSWSTFIGGDGVDTGHAVRLDAAGNVAVTGHTSAPDFPVTPGAYDVSPNGGADIFVVKLSPAGDDLIWSTLIGGSDDDKQWGNPFCIDTQGNLVIAGRTRSGDFPTTPGVFDRTHNGDWDVVLAKISPSGDDLVWSTFLGGSLMDGKTQGYGSGLAVDSDDNPIVCGSTESLDFPTTVGAVDTTHNGGFDAFVSKFSASSGDLLWSTLLGGSIDDGGYAVGIAPLGDVLVGGWTQSSDYPTTSGAYLEAYGGGDYDGFITKLGRDGAPVIWSSFLGGVASDFIFNLIVDPSGNLLVTGRADSPEFPTTDDGYSMAFGGEGDVFLTKIAPTGDEVLYGTFLGGSQYDVGWGIELDEHRNPVISGYTWSPDFPTTPLAYDVYFDGHTDVFVAHLDIGAIASIEDPIQASEVSGICRAHPNPASGNTCISFEGKARSEVRLMIYDARGRRVCDIRKGQMPAGAHTIEWDGTNAEGQKLSSGMYLYELHLGDTVDHGKLILVD